MSVAFDTTALLVAIAPVDKVQTRVGGILVSDAKARIDFLIETLEKDGRRLIIPVPALAEALVNVESGVAQRFIERMSKARSIVLAPFDILEGLEAAAMAGEALRAGDKRGGARGDYQKIKVDRQIVAIAKFHGATVIYSNDDGVRTLGRGQGLAVMGVESLPLPPSAIEPPLLERMKDDPA